MGNIAKIDSKKTGLVQKVAERFSVDADKMLATLKSTAFKVKDGNISNEQMMALLVVADQYGLNPFTKELYAFPDKQNGIVPVVGVDGWLRIINEQPTFDGMDFSYADDIVEGEDHKPCPAFVTCTIHRRDRTHPIVVTEYLDECYREPFKTQSGAIKGPWQTHTKRMLRHKAMIQAARIAFGFVGFYDPDEADRIREGQIIDVTPEKDDAADLNKDLGLAE